MSKLETLRKLKDRKEEILKRIALTEQAKKEITNIVQKLVSQLSSGRISRREYEEKLNHSLKGRTAEQWLKYYDDYIQYYNYQIKLCDKLIKQEKFGKIKQTIKEKAVPALKISIILVAIALMFSLVFILKPLGTSVFTKIGEKVSTTISHLTEKAPEAPVVTPVSEFVEPTLPVNLEDKTVLIKEESLIQYQAVLGKPVKWKKQFTVDSVTGFTIELPKGSKNVSVKTLKQGKQEDITEYIDIGKKHAFLIFGEKAVEVSVNKNSITRNTILNSKKQEFEIYYETPAPVAEEEIIETGKKTITGNVIVDSNEINRDSKRIIINGPDDVHYKNILSFTELPKELTKEELGKFGLYQIKDNQRIETQFTVYDTDENGLYDYIEWITPELSEAEFLWTIKITKAYHLGTDRITVLSDIYPEVKALDDNWSETINDSEYVRVTFQIPLDNTRDITLYPRVVNGTPRIEVYEIDGSEKIAEFANLQSNQYNKVLLTNLSEGHSQDVFDLRVVGGSIEIEHIVDPTIAYEPITNKTYRCGILNISNTLFMMNQSIENNTLSEPCINITAQNITLDCNGFYIKSSSNKAGVYSNQLNTIIKNCNISMGLSGGYGIYLKGANNSYVFNNILNSQDRGLHLLNTHNTKIENNTLNSNQNYGIKIEASSNNTLINNKAWNCTIPFACLYLDDNSNENIVLGGIINKSTTNLIYIKSQSKNNVFANIQLYDSTNNSIYVENSQDNIFDNLTIISDVNYSGIYSNSINTTIKNCNISMGLGSGGHGIYLQGASNSYVFNNSLYRQYIGLYLNLTSNTKIENNTLNFNVKRGIMLDYSINNTLLENIILNSSASDGIYLRYNSNNNYLIKNIVINNTEKGIRFSNSSNNIIQDNIVNLNKEVGIHFEISSSNNFVRDGVINGNGKDVWSKDNSLNNTFLNVSYDSSKETVEAGSSLIRKWYYQANITYNNAGVANANLFAYNRTGIPDGWQFNLTSNSTGFTNITTIIDYISNGTRNYYSNYTINTTNGSLSESHKLNVTLASNNSGMGKFGGLVFENIDLGGVIDITAPIVYLLAPLSSSLLNNRTIWFVANNADNTLLKNSTLYIWNSTNSAVNITNRIISGISNITNISVTLPYDGSFKWNYYTCDNSNNCAWSNTNWTLTIDSVAPFINFTEITPKNGTTINDDNFGIGVNASDVNRGNNNISAFIDFDNSLVGWWRMDEVNQTTPGAKVYDNSSYGNNGTAKGNATQGEGYLGKGFEFDGEGDYIDCGGNTILNTNITRTVSLWIKTGSSANHTTIIGRKGGNGQWSLNIESSGKLRWHDWIDSGTQDLGGNANVSDGNWHYIVATLDKTVGKITFYVDGKFDAQGSCTQMGTATGNLYIGSCIEVAGSSWCSSSYAGYNNYFNGSIDDVMIFNRALSLEEISALYADSSSKYLFRNFENLAFGNHTFKAYAQDIAGNVNSTEERSVVIPDSIAPNVIINFPLNASYNSHSINFNVVAVDNIGMSSCWYSLNSGVNNITMTNTTSLSIYNHTNSSISDGSYTARFYCNDTSNIVNNSESVTFSIDTIAPNINFTLPTPANGTPVYDNFIPINVSANDSQSYISTFIDFDNSLVGWWRMDDVYSCGSGNGVCVYDNSSYGNNGTAYGNATQGQGYLGKGFSFDGKGDYISIGNNSALAGKEVTINAWVYWKGSSNNYDSIVSQINSSFRGYNFYIDSEGSLAFGLDYWYIAYSGVAFPKNEWHFVTGIHNNTYLSVYIDGVLKGTLFKPGFGADAEGFIGFGGFKFYSDYFNGSIDDVMIFNRALSIEELQGLYANSSEKYLFKNFSELNAGAYKFKAYAQDRAGNINFTETKEVEVKYDNIPPIINFTFPTPANGNITFNNFIPINVSANDSQNNISVFIDFNRSLVGWWRMDDVLGNTVIDYSSYGYNGTKQGDTKQVDDGYFGKAFSFDGNTGLQDMINISYLQEETQMFNKSFTAVLWVKRLGAENDMSYMVGTIDQTGVQGWTLRMAGQLGKVRFQGNNGTTSSSDINADSLTYNVWTQVVGVYNGTALIIYINGISKATGTSNVSNTGYGNDRTLSIGFSTSPSRTWNGSIDDVMIFSRALSPEEISALYANSSEKYLFHNFENLQAGNYTFKAYAQDLWGNVNSTEKREVEIKKENEITGCRNLGKANTVYTQTKDITTGRAGGGNCIVITAQNITFDCQGKYININQNYAGVYSAQFNTTIKNCNVSMGSGSGGYGIYLQGATNSYIFNSILNNNQYGILLQSSSNNILTGINATNNAYGIYISSSSDNILTNITSENNNYGISLSSSPNNLIKNSNLSENNIYDFYILTTSDSHCNNKLESVTGSGNKEIGYSNSSASSAQLSNREFSELVLCNADNSVLNNITISGSNKKNNGLLMTITDNSNLTNINSKGNYEGISLSSSSSNNLINITTSNNSRYGIWLYSSSSNILTGINTTGNPYGIYLQSSSSNNLTNINSENNEEGIYILNSFNNVLANIIAFSNNNGVHFYQSSINSITNLSSSSNNNGVYFDNSNNNNIKNSNIFSNNNGIFLYLSFWNTITNITANSNTQYGIYLQSSSSNNLTNITANSNTQYGIYLSSSSSNNIYDFKIWNSSSGSDYGGVYFYGSSNNVFERGYINKSSNGVILDYIRGHSSNNLFKDMWINNTDLSDIYFKTGGGLNNTFLNASYNASKENIGLGNELIRKWYYQAYINDTAGNNVSGANITAYNKNNKLVESLKTDDNGLTPLGSLIEYVNNGTRNYYSNYTINASKLNYETIIHEMNVTEKKNFFDFFTFGVKIDTTPPEIIIVAPHEGEIFKTNKSISLNFTTNETMNKCWWTINNGGKNTSVLGVIGDEKTTNGGFDSGSFGWVVGSYWSLSGGSATFSTSGSGVMQGSFQQNINIQSGKTYAIKSEIISYSTSTDEDTYCWVNFTLGGVSGNNIGSAETFSETITTVNTNNLSINGYYYGDKEFSSCNIVIDYVSVKEVGCANTTIDVPEGSINLILYGDDIYGNIGNDSVSFFADGSAPAINFTNPTPSNGSWNYTFIPINVFASDVNRGNNNISTFIDFDKSLVGWWRMDDVNQTTPGAKVIDYTGKNNGTAYGNATQGEGYLGKGFEFDGDGDYISVQHSDSLNISKEITVGLWAKSNIDWDSHSNEWANLIVKRGGGNEVGWGIVIDNANPRVSFDLRTTVQQPKVWTTGNLVKDEWYYIVGTYNGSDLKIYLNGKLNNTNNPSGDIVTSNHNITIGKWRDINDEFFNGSIDDVMIFNRSLSKEEISALYANSSSKYLFKNFTNLNFGNHTFKAYAQDKFGNVNSTEKREVEIKNYAPKIVWIQNISEVTPTEDGVKNVSFNFTAYDGNGFSDLNSSSARANFTKLGYSVVRENLSCSFIKGSGNYANYSCTIGMWYFDKPGFWNITVTIADKSGLTAINDSGSFYYKPTGGIKISPSILDWGVVSMGEINKNLSYPMIVNNTGNIIINLTINASSLYEENYNYIFGVGNFSVNVINECEGDILKDSQIVNITNSTLAPGNLSEGGGKAQKNLYFCIEQVPDLLGKTYSTKPEFPWRISYINVYLAVAVIFRRRKRKELKQKSKQKLLQIPLVIFRQELSPAEVLCKYLKENIGLKISEISEILNRDETTISINYRNAAEKMKEKIVLRESRMFVSAEIFSDRRLSILESIVNHLRGQGLRNLEIAEMLNRDQRIISSVYLRAKRKLKTKAKEIEIPIDIFKNGVGGSGMLYKYLRENLGLEFNEIARLINRAESTVWMNYRNINKIIKEKIEIEKEMLVSIKIFSERRLSILESVVKYLKEKGLRNYEIAELLGKDERNIYTLYSRARKKLSI